MVFAMRARSSCSSARGSFGFGSGPEVAFTMSGAVPAEQRLLGLRPVAVVADRGQGAHVLEAHPGIEVEACAPS